jgi:cation transport protein ChaC
MTDSMQRRWVFGYGSLMWNPGFRYTSCHIARIQGYHRSLCVFSYHYRGTPEKPGLVLALDRGGACSGVAFEIAADQWDGTVAYLRAREQITMVYREIICAARLRETGRVVEVLTYAADRGHEQYAGKLSHDSMLQRIAQGQGHSGSCRDYVMNTVRHLHQIGLHDRPLERLARELAE